MTDLRERLHDALDEADFSPPELMRRAMSGVDAADPTRRLRWAPPLGAAAIAAAVIITLVAVALNRPAPHAASLPTADTVDNLAGYQFVSPDVGWMLFGDQDEVVARTSDGGVSWHQVLAIPEGFAPFMTMQAVDANTAVVIGEDLRGEGIVWKTDDAGAHWTLHVIKTPKAQEEPVNVVSEPIVGVNGYFSDANSGWIVFAMGGRPCPANSFCPLLRVGRQLVYRTTDGGATWKPTGWVPLQLWSHVAVRFAGADDGIVVAVNGRRTTIGGSGMAGQDLVRTTHDGGVTWSIPDIGLVSPACPPAPGCGAYWTAEPYMLSTKAMALVFALYEQTSPATLEQVKRTLFRSDDGGRTWRKAADLPLTYGGMAVLDERTLIDVSPSGVRRSDDSGITWRTIGDSPIPEGWTALNVEFLDATHGWILTWSTGRDHAQAIFATSDGGKTWRQQPLPVVKA